MNDWYSTYLFIWQRQADAVREAEQRRLLDAGRGIGWERVPAGRRSPSPLRYRLWQKLIAPGRSMQQPGPGVPAS
jgi:hypothetical protein